MEIHVAYELTTLTELYVLQYGDCGECIVAFLHSGNLTCLGCACGPVGGQKKVAVAFHLVGI
jgi:hypothetical protein